MRLITVIDTSGRVIGAVRHEPGHSAEVMFNLPNQIPPNQDTPSLTWKYGAKTLANPLLFGLDATELSITQPIKNGALGWLKINFSLTQVHSQAIKLLIGSIIFALVGVAVLVIILTRLLQPTLVALEEATNFTRGLNQVHGQQIAVYDGSSEINNLDQALNETSLQLHTQDIEIFNANKLLQDVLDASTRVSIIATDVDGTIILFNLGAERLLGYSAKELIGIQTPAIFHLAEEVQTRSGELTMELGYPIAGVQAFH